MCSQTIWFVLWKFLAALGGIERTGTISITSFSCCSAFLTNREIAVTFLNTCDGLYVFDGFANWDRNVSSWSMCLACGDFSLPVLSFLPGWFYSGSGVIVIV